MNRRQLLGLLFSTAASTILGERVGARPLDQGIGGTGVAPSDQGIGGTGVAPPADESDRGIGGTGVIGTIRKFGSIVVNDLRIAYPKDADVRIDGKPASVFDLKIGQVVRVAAKGKDDALSTKTIDVTSEVVGPVEKTGKSSLTVLGQKVSTKDIETGDVKKGDIVAISGLRRNDGTIVASLVEPRPGAPSRVAGPLVSKSGKLKIGGLKVSGVAPDLAGRRVLLEGARDGSRFVASHATAETALLPRSVRNLSIESYVERRGDSLRLGSGYGIGSGGDLDFPSGRSVRAVLQTRIEPDGRLAVESLRAGGRTYGGPGRGGPGGGGHGGGGHGGGGHGGGRGGRGGGPGRGRGGPDRGGPERGGPERGGPGRGGGPDRDRGRPGRDREPGREDRPHRGGPGGGPGEHGGRRGGPRGDGWQRRGGRRRAEGTDFGSDPRGGFDNGGPRGGSFDPSPHGGGGGFGGPGGGFDTGGGGRGPGGFGGPGGGFAGGGGGPGGGFGGPGGGGGGPGGGGPGGGGFGGGGGGGRR